MPTPSDHWRRLIESATLSVINVRANLRRLLLVIVIGGGAVLLLVQCFWMPYVADGLQHSATFSSASAAASGLLVKTLPLDPSYIAIGQDTTRIVEAWIERASRVHCYAVLPRCTREAADGYLEAFRVDRSRRMHSVPLYLAEGDSTHAWSRRTSDSAVFFHDVVQPLPDTLRLAACEWKVDRNGDSVPDRHPSIPACP